MITQQTQIKLNLPIALKDLLESKANKYGMPVAAYLKHIILKEIEKEKYSAFKTSVLPQKKQKSIK